MAITTLHLGVIGQQEFAKLAVLGSDGRLEVMLPMSDDEQRDAEVHRRNRFGRSLAIQIKVSGRLVGGSDNPILHVRFHVAKERLINHPFFWYFFAYLDQEAMQLGQICFLIPSTTFHEQALRIDLGKEWEYHLTAALGADAGDRWAGHRVARQLVGARLMGIIDDLEGRPGDETSADMSLVQKGLITVSEFAKLLILGSGGELDANLPLTSDDQPDVEVRQHGRFDPCVSFKVHGVTHLYRYRHRQADRLGVRFEIAAERVRSNPRFWYFFAYLDRHQMGFGSPCFVVPSQEVHLHAFPHRKMESVYFYFQASMAAGSADHWAPYRVEPLKVGQHVLEIVRNSARPDAAWPSLKAS
jgi:hypothetical protein